MKTKTLLLLVLVVILPTTLLSWGGFQLARQQSDQFEIQVTELLRDQLTELDSRIKRYFSEQEAKLQDLTSRNFTTFDSIREVTNSHGVIDNIFVITAKGNLVYPNPIYELNEREKDFYTRIKTIYEDGEIQNAVMLATANSNPAVSGQGNPGSAAVPNSPGDVQQEDEFKYAPQNNTPQLNSNEPAANNPAANDAATNEPSDAAAQSNAVSGRGTRVPRQTDQQTLDQDQQQLQQGNLQQSNLQQRSRSVPQNRMPSNLQNSQQSSFPQILEPPVKYEPCSGWFVWYWGRGVNLIYWQRITTGTIVCVALERSRWMSDLITELPDTVQAEIETGDETKSSNPRTTKIVNSNGEAVYLWGSDVSEEMVLAAEVPVTTPLTAWKLQMWVMPAELKSQSVVGINILLGIAAFSIALVAVAWIFFRDYAKEIKEAGRRVSFVNQVSHELRTPLTNIRMYAELLDSDLQQMDGIDAEKAQSRIRIVESECERLSRLIGNVLTFAGSQKNGLEIHRQTGVVDDCVTQTLSGFAPNLEKLGMEIQTDLDASGSVRFDGDAVGQILGNLISNVEKYASDGKFVRVSTRQFDGITEIVVEDDGDGIDAKDATKIFEPFWRKSNELQHASGTGIGLSISRELARLHGGDLTLEASEHGARFVIRLNTEKAE